MRNLIPFNKFNESLEISESNWTERGKDDSLKTKAEQIYNMVKNRPFTNKHDCIIDIVRVLRKVCNA